MAMANFVFMTYSFVNAMFAGMPQTVTAAYVCVRAVQRQIVSKAWLL